MAKLSQEQVKKVAKLANLPLSDEEVYKCKEQLSEALVYVEKLNEINIDNVEPKNQATNLINVTRKDESFPSFSQEDALKNAPVKEGGFFKVKAIFE